jgi:glutamate synthase (NADPH/NADH) small chain
MPMPPKAEDKLLTWPNWPLKLRTSSSHEEGAERDFAVTTTAFEGENGVVTGLKCAHLDERMKPIEGSEFTLKADLVLLAMGFVSPVKEGLLSELGVALDKRGNVAADVTRYASSRAKVYACGDMRRGQSLVVWAIREGRRTTPSTAGIGPSSTSRARNARCFLPSLGGMPGEGMLMRPSGPCSLKRSTQSRNV